MGDGPSLKMERWGDGEMGRLEDGTSGVAMPQDDILKFPQLHVLLLL